MRLLRIEDDGEYSLVELVGNDTPPYAILSHTWGPAVEEVTFKDIMNGSYRHKAGDRKIQFCGKQAERDGLQYFWVDTCCIDNSSSAELSEAVNSIFRWFQNAARCYVYLSDISVKDFNGISDQREWKPAFRRCKWFTRGWMIQELIAPASVEFFSREGMRLGDKQSLAHTIHETTGIPIEALHGSPMSEFSIEERMSWVAHRQTTREEDKAYCLLGILGVSMPAIYGEGTRNAFIRLQKEIQESQQWSSTISQHDIPHEPQSRQNYGNVSALISAFLNFLDIYVFFYDPFELLVPRVRSGYKRLQWHCSCDSALWGDFPVDNPAVDQLKRELFTLKLKREFSTLNSEREWSALKLKRELSTLKLEQQLFISKSQREWFTLKLKRGLSTLNSEREWSALKLKRELSISELEHELSMLELEQELYNLELERELSNLEWERESSRSRVSFTQQAPSGGTSRSPPNTKSSTSDPKAIHLWPMHLTGPSTVLGGVQSASISRHKPTSVSDLAVSSATRIININFLPKYFEICINTGNYAIDHHEIDISRVTSDGELFELIWNRYSSSRGIGRRRLFLRPRNVHFVMFSLSRRTQYGAGIHMTPDEFPPQQELDKKRYHYLCPKIKMPVNVFLHYLHRARWNTWGEHTEDTWLQRLPKKLSESLLAEVQRDDATDPNLAFGWGIHILDGPNHAVLSLLLLIGVAVSFVVSGMIVGFAKTQEQGFGVGNFLLAILASIMAAVYFKLQDL